VSQQQETLSVRIGPALRQRLERMRERVVSETGQSVSISRIAKRVLESVRNHAVEVADLLAEPTEALSQMQRKREAGVALTTAEWALLVYFVVEGLKTVGGESGTPSVQTPTVCLLDAFMAVYEQCRPSTARDQQRVENLTIADRPPAGERRHVGRSGELRQIVADTRRRVLEETAVSPALALGAARNLSLLLDEDLVGVESINSALAPHWPALWPMAARGHYATTGRPVRRAVWAPLIEEAAGPVVAAGRVRLSLEVRQEVGVFMMFSGAGSVMYPITRYPELREFRMMLATLGPTVRLWDGRYFQGLLIDADESGVRFRGKGDRIVVGCQRADWDALRSLYQQAWERVEVQQTWARLTMEYGE